MINIFQLTYPSMREKSISEINEETTLLLNNLRIMQLDGLLERTGGLDQPVDFNWYLIEFFFRFQKDGSNINIAFIGMTCYHRVRCNDFRSSGCSITGRALHFWMKPLPHWILGWRKCFIGLLHS